MFEKIDNWEVLKRPAPGSVDTNSFDTDHWTILATLDSDENIGIKIKFEELTKEEIRSRNFPEFGEINPVIRSIKVDFPEPLLPIMPTKLYFLIFSVNEFKTDSRIK